MNLSQVFENTELVITGGVALLAAGIALWMRILERRPREDLNPRLVPTTPIMFISMMVAVLALVHFLNLVGIHTGR